MKSFTITVILLVLACSVSRAQDSLRLQRYEYVIGAALAFSFADYVIDNHLRADAGWPSNYRVPVLYRLLQGGIQAGITYFLYKNFGLPSAITFNFLTWTGCLDLDILCLAEHSEMDKTPRTTYSPGSRYLGKLDPGWPSQTVGKCDRSKYAQCTGRGRIHHRYDHSLVKALKIRRAVPNAGDGRSSVMCAPV